MLRFVASYDTRNLVRARKQVERYSQMDQISISNSLLSLSFISLDVKIADLETVGDPVTPAKFLQYCQFIYHELPIRIYIFLYSYLRNGQKNRWPWKDALWIKWYWRHKKSSRLVSLFLLGHRIQPKTSVYTCDNSPVFRKPTDAMQFADVLEQIYDRHSAVLHLSLLWHDRRFSPYQEAFLLSSSNSKNKPHQRRENSRRSNNWDPFWMSSICLE